MRTYQQAEKDRQNIEEQIVSDIERGSEFSDLLRKISDVEISEDLIAKKRTRRIRKTTGTVNSVDENCFDHLGKKYDIILVDPPWDYKRKSGAGVAANWYDSLTIEQLKKLPVGKIAARNCLLVFWITNPMDIYYKEILEAWGFEYKNWGFVWMKVTRKEGEPRILLGNYTRTCTESLYLSTKSEPDEPEIKKKKKTAKEKPPMWVEFKYEDDSVGGVGIFSARKGETPLINRESREVSSIIQTFFDDGELKVIRTNLPGGKGKHSIKPMGVIDEKLRTFYGSNYDNMNRIELFSRTNYAGWDSWGKEAGEIDEDGKRKAQEPEDATNQDIRDHIIMNKKKKKRKLGEF